MTTQSPIQECLRCGSLEDTNIRLDCGHSICLVCLSYITIKLESKLLSFPTSIDCPLCNQKTLLSPKSISTIKITIEKVLVPQFHETLNYSPSNSPYTSTLQRPIQELPEPQSPQHCCFNQKLTGMTTTMNQSIDITVPTKSTGSYCSSPKLESKQSRSACKIHPFEEYMFSCTDCNNQFLCLKCFTDDHHSNHNIRSIKKTLELCVEQIGFSRMEIGERIQLFELAQKRLVNRKQLIKTRLAMSLDKATETFEDIFKKLREKEDEIFREINLHFGKIEDGIQMEIQSLKYKIQEAKFLSNKVKDVNPNQNPLEFIRVCFELEKELEEKQSTSTLQIFKKVTNNKQIIEIAENSINSLYHYIDTLNLNQSIQSAKQLRMDTVPSIRTKSYQKHFRTEKTDPGEQQSTRQSKTRIMHMRLQQTKSNASPDQISQIISRQFSCKNMFNKQKQEQFSITSNDIQHSFASSKPMSKDSKERRQRKTYGNYQLLERPAKIQKSQFQKKLKKVINKNK